MLLRECVSTLDWFCEAWPLTSKRSGGRQRQTGNHSSATSSCALPCLYLSIWFPPPGRGFLTVCFSPWRQPLWAHISHSFIMRCQPFLSPWLHKLAAFGMPSLSCPRCPYVKLSISLFLFHIYTSVYLSVDWPACHFFCQINRSPTYQFVLLTGLPFLSVSVAVGTSHCSFFPPRQSVKLILLYPLNEPRSGILSYWSQSVWLLKDFLMVV